MAWKGWAYAEDALGFGQVAPAVDVPLVQAGIAQILNTIPGERRMLPEFGSVLKLLLFDPHDATLYAELGKETVKAIERWEPRVQVERVEIAPVEGDDHAVDVFLAWSLVQNDKVSSSMTVRVG